MTRNNVSAIVISIVLLLLAACTKPPGDANQSAAAGTNESPRIASTDVVKATPEELTLAKGESAYAIVRLQIQNGYHINANPPTFRTSKLRNSN